jgi:hypothetical protein
MSLDPDAEITVVVEPVRTVEVFATQVGPVGPQWQGAWSPLVTYLPTDLVTRNGSVWIATAENTGIDPDADASKNIVGSLDAPSPIATGSPTSLASGFRVEQGIRVVAMLVNKAYSGPPGGRIGIASEIHAPGIGIEWLGSGPSNALWRVELDTPVVLSPGVRYWHVLDELPMAASMVEDGVQLIGDNMEWSGEFYYGATEPTSPLHTYGFGVVLYGTSADDPWQLYLQGTP